MEFLPTERRNLPNAVLIIVLGIFGYLCCCVLGAGIIPAGIAFFLARQSENEYKENPDQYLNYDQIKTGKIVALIALILNVLMIIRVVYVLTTGDWELMRDEFMRGWEEALEAQG